MATNTTEYKKLKSPNEPLNCTLSQLKEMIDCAKDPLYFMENYMYVQRAVEGRVKFQAYDFQKTLIKTYVDNRNSICMIPRQSGKTITAAGYLLWYAMFNADSTILIAAHKFKAASEIMNRIKYTYEDLPDYIRPGVVDYNVQSIKFDNGSRIIATTTTHDSGRGMSISVLYLDEFSFVRPNIAKEFWAGIAPTLSTGGKCIITSTPHSDEDMFAEIWFNATKTVDEDGIEIPNGVGINGFKAFSAAYYEVPGRDESWANEQRAMIGDDKFDREYNCVFAGEESTLINSLALQRLTSCGRDPIFKIGDIRWYEKILQQNTYVIALDPSAGIGKDNACIQVWSLPDMKQVAEWSSNRVSIPNQVRNMQKIINYINSEIKKQGFKSEPEIYYTLENNSWGEAALQTVADIGEENFAGQFLHEPKRFGLIRKRKGLNTNVRSKAAACARFKSLIEGNRLTISSRLLIKELKFFVSKGNSFEAKTGETDDCVMATLLCVRLMQMVTNWDDRVGDLLQDVFDDDQLDNREPMPFSVLIS